MNSADLWSGETNKATPPKDGMPKDGMPYDLPFEVIDLPVEERYTDAGNGRRFAAAIAGRARYCPPRKAWLVWDGRRWTWDKDGAIWRLAKETVGLMYRAAVRMKDKAAAQHATNTESLARLRAMVELAQSEEGIPVELHELDSNPHLLNCANGTVDLRTGELRPHDKADLITRIVPIPYDPKAESLLWARFLLEACNNDVDLVRFLARGAGYCATGLTTERKFFFLYGKSTTGKSTFVDAIRCALGEYAMDIDFDSLLVQRNTGGNRGDLVRLAGSRVAIASEVRRKARFDVKIVKAISGGDPITASAKYENEVTFTPTFSLMLAANDAPYIHEEDDGMWRRCMRIPFDVQVEKPDPSIKARLSDPTGPDAAGVLAWIVDGAMVWYREGLGTADAVERSTRAYRDEVDVFGAFVDECCRLDPGEQVTKATFRAAYEKWSVENGLRPLGGREVKMRLEAMGVLDQRTNSERRWKGIGLA